MVSMYQNALYRIWKYTYSMTTTMYVLLTCMNIRDWFKQFDINLKHTPKLWLRELTVLAFFSFYLPQLWNHRVIRSRFLFFLRIFTGGEDRLKTSSQKQAQQELILGACGNAGRRCQILSSVPSCNTHRKILKGGEKTVPSVLCYRVAYDNVCKSIRTLRCIFINKSSKMYMGKPD